MRRPARVPQSLSHRAAQEIPPTQVGFFVCARCTVRSINGAIVRSPAGGLGNYTVATNCTGTLDFGPPTHFTYDFFIAPEAAYLVMIQTGGPVPGVLLGTADKLSR
jgi:hypothetical protein